MADATSPPASAAPSQKRPLEEPSSPSSHGEQPEAKRQALDKVIKEDATNVNLDTKPDQTNAEGQTNGESHTNGQVDTVIPDAPVTAVKPEDQQAIQSTATNVGAIQTPTLASQDESQWLHLRAIISSAEAATVIGKGGENVTIIRNKSGARCTVSDYTRGAVERTLTVSGTTEAVAKAFALIIRTLNQEDLDASSTAHSKTYPLRLLIPHMLIGSVIGKAGARIREIQSVSGARLNASESCLPLSTERSLVVLGVADAIHIAVYYVGQTLVEQLTQRFGGPAASAYATRSGHPAGAVPGGMQVVPYQPQSLTGVWGHPDNLRRSPYASQRTPSNPYGLSQPYGQQPVQPDAQPQAQAQAPMPYAAGPSTPYSAVNPQHTTQYAAAARPTAQPGASGPTTQPMQGVGGAITQQIYIPNDMVGAIIGKGGAKINEIRQLSGSVIKINEPQDNSNERLVTVTGNPTQNQMALFMLYNRLENEKHRI